MNLTLNRNSWHAKLYTLVLESEPPKTLCPYFWTLFAIFVFSPIILVIVSMGWVIKGFESVKTSVYTPKPKPEKTLEEIRKEWDEQKIRDARRSNNVDLVLNVFIFTIKWVVAPLAALFLIYAVYISGTKMGWGTLLLTLLIAIICMVPVLGLIWLFDKYQYTIGGFLGRVFKTLNPFNWSITKMIGGMIYATYKKACPIIQWEGGDNNETENENVYN